MGTLLAVRRQGVYCRKDRAALLIAAVVVTLVVAWSSASLAYGVTFSDRVPPPGTIQTTPFKNSTGWLYPAYPFQVRVATTDGATISPADCRMYIDGASQSVRSFTPGTNVLIRGNYTVEWAPPDGPHTAKVVVTDSYGATWEDTWSFVTAIAPVIPPSWYYMADSQGMEFDDFNAVTVQRPTFGIAYDDANDAAASLRFVVSIDGVEVFDGADVDASESAYPNTFYYAPDFDLSVGSHTVSFTVSDPSGNTTTASWGFTIIVPEPMSQTPDCQICHTDQPAAHPMDDCSACHPALADDYGGTTPHSGSDWQMSYYIERYGCEGCHNESNEWVPIHTEQSIAAAHISLEAGTCLFCHESDLLAEHAKYPADSEFKYQCNTCHASVDPGVANAIAAGDTSCTGCHTLAPDHGEPGPGHAGIASPACVECHGDDVVALHPEGCGTCHPAPAPSTCEDCHPGIDLTTHGAGRFFRPSAQNPNHTGYLSWQWAVSNAEETATPHGNYTTTSNKCAVCHSVHRATADGVALTAVPEVGYADYTDACAFCHAEGSTFTDAVVMVDVNGTIDPHGECNRCHIASPHGAGASQCAVLNARLLNTRADAAIAADSSDTSKAAVLTAEGVDFDDPANQQALTMGTGYLCGACHQGPVYAVAGDDYKPGAATVTGHRVLAEVTTTWNQAKEYGAYYTGGGVAGAQSQVAWNPTGTCAACHDQKLADGVTPAFPHGYVDAAGAYVGKTGPGAGYIWLTTAADADDPRDVLVRGSADQSDLVTRDGLCLKCHVSGDGTAGVGESY